MVFTAGNAAARFVAQSLLKLTSKQGILLLFCLAGWTYSNELRLF